MRGTCFTEAMRDTVDQQEGSAVEEVKWSVGQLPGEAASDVAQKGLGAEGTYPSDPLAEKS